MVMYFALNPKDYVNSKYFPRDLSSKKRFEDTPLMIKIKSQRGVKFATELVDALAKEFELQKKADFVPETYKFAYMSDGKLLELGKAQTTYVEL